METAHITEAKAWDEILLGLPNPHILQSWSWGAFKSRHGWDVTRLMYSMGGKPVAAASILQRKLPKVPLSILYVPKGPVLEWQNARLAERIIEKLEIQARKRRALFVKVDPDLYYAKDLPALASRPARAGDLEGLLKGRGWRFSEDQIQFRNTVLLDLKPSEEELMAGMKQKTRYNVRLARRRGVTIRQITSADAVEDRRLALELFFELYEETASRDGFLIRAAGYYYDAWETFLEEGLAHLLLAEVEGETVAGLILFTFGAAAWYMYGASSNRHRKHMPNQLLQWEAMRCAKDAGCALYDLWGAPDELVETDPMWGVVRFKLGLGGELARGLGAWDYPTGRVRYWLYSTAMPWILDWMRTRSSAGNSRQPVSEV
jgi:lipid II:glycine glycyltransferase (peptidoglycan interpeptide bridge formation enzyme)